MTSQHMNSLSLGLKRNNFYINQLIYSAGCRKRSNSRFAFRPKIGEDDFERSANRLPYSGNRLIY